MSYRISVSRPSTVCGVACALALLSSLGSQVTAQRRDGVPALPPPAEQLVLRTAEVPRIRVVPVALGLSHPWGMAFRQNGDILVTERDKGTLRVIRDGQLLDRAIPGVPEVASESLRAGLMDIALHPDDDRIVYLSYSKAIEKDGEPGVTVALARGRLDAGALTEVRDIFVAEGLDSGIAASRVLFAEDGTLFMTVGGSYVFADTGDYAQDPTTHFGKLMRMNDDGSAVVDNPFFGSVDYLPEIYSMGHRNQLGLAFHPETGDLWATENGPQGGDEANIIRAGQNYGWPVASYSRQYSGVPVTNTPWLAGFESPEVLWWPSIGPSGLTFYTGEHFPAWHGNLFVGSMRVGGMPHTGNVQRIVFNRQGQEIRRESLLADLKQRVRDIRQGPDGYLYVLTDEDDGVLLRIEPAHAIADAPGTNVLVNRLSAPRISPLAEAEWTNEQREVVEKYEADGFAGSALRTLARVPALADRTFPFMRYVSRDSTLSPRHRAILTLRVAWLTQSANLWTSHANHALEAGVTAEDVQRIAEGSSADTWSEFDRALLSLADELFQNASVSDNTWEALASQYDVLNLVDAVMTVSDTTARAVVFNSLGVQPDAPSDDTSLADPDRTAALEMPTATVAYRVEAPDREPPLTTPRIEPLDGPGLRVSRTFAQHQAMADARATNPGYILNPERSRLAPHDRELLILRTGWNNQAVYEWAKHVGSVGRARDHGLEPEWIAQGKDANGWNETERALIDAADEMYRDSMISDDTWAVLSERYDTHQMISIAATTARYRMVSMALNAFGVQPRADDERFPVLAGY